MVYKIQPYRNYLAEEITFKFATAMTKNHVFHARTKHIELRHHFIRDLVGEGEIQLQFVSTNDQMFSPKQLQLTEWSGSRSN